MGWAYNPFTGKLDKTGASCPGSDTNIIFNDGTAYGAAGDLLWNKTLRTLTLQDDDNDAVAGSFIFLKTRGAAGQDSDAIGTISWKSYNDAATPELIEFMAIRGEIIDASDATEDGCLKITPMARGIAHTDSIKLGAVWNRYPNNDQGPALDFSCQGGGSSATAVLNFTNEYAGFSARVLSSTWLTTTTLKTAIQSYAANAPCGYEFSCNGDANAAIFLYSSAGYKPQFVIFNNAEKAGTSADQVVVICGQAVAPTTCPADAVQLWVIDEAAGAGDARLVIMGEASTDKVTIGNGIVNCTDGTNGVSINETGLISFTGDAVCTVRERPTMAGAYAGAKGKPTPVARGAFAGYSLPIYNSDDEELFFRCNVPRRWNGTTNPTVTVVGYLDTAETENDEFQLVLAWFNEVCDNTANALADTVTEVHSGDISVGTEREAQYNIFAHTFTIDFDVADPHLTAGDVLGFRLRRHAVDDGNEIAGEFVVIDCYITWTYDKVFYHA